MKPTVQEQKPGMVSVDIVPSNEYIFRKMKAVITKPTVQEQKPGIVSVDIVPSNEAKKQSNKLITKFIIVVVSLILVCGVVLTAVYFGKRLTSDNIKEYHALVHRVGGPTTAETWRLTDSEEEFENNDTRVIYDFKTGLAVYVLKQQEYLTDCYVVSFNMTKTETPANMRRRLPSTEFEITITETILMVYKVTDVWLNPIALGKRSQIVCDGKNIYMMKSVKESRTRKMARNLLWMYDNSTARLATTYPVKSYGSSYRDEFEVG